MTIVDRLCRPCNNSHTVQWSGFIRDGLVAMRQILGNGAPDGENYGKKYTDRFHTRSSRFAKHVVCRFFILNYLREPGREEPRRGVYFRRDPDSRPERAG